MFDRIVDARHDTCNEPTSQEMIVALGSYFETYHVPTIFTRAAYKYMGDRANSVEIERAVRRYFVAYHKNGAVPHYIDVVYAKIIEGSGD